jgi:hypothetical protein
MSDHEDISQDDWEEGTLPDIPGAGTSYARSESLMKPSRNLAIRPGRPLRDGTTARFPGFEHGDPARDDRYSHRPHTQPTNGIPGRATGVEARQVRLKTLQANREAEKKRVGPPAKSYVMRVTWHTLLSNIKSDHIQQARLARMRLDEIAALTDTYIETPSANITEIWIWGTTDQAAAAHDLLSIWESEVRETRAPRDNWIKQNALDGRMEERKERQAMYKQIKSQWKEDAVGHSTELILIWNHSIGLEDFQQEHARTIQDLEEAYQTRILCDRISSKVHVFGHDQNVALEVHNRIVNIAREMVAKRNEVIRANFLRYPLHGTYRSSVQLTKDDRSDNFLPSLCGKALEQDAIARYQTFSKSANHDTRVKTRRHIERGLTGHLQLSSKHVRMRVTFLDLAFLQFKRPSDEKPYHDFHEYVAMIGDERTTIKAQGLRNNGKDFSQLGDKLSEFLGQSDIAYAIHFDFGMGTMQKGATLRFECDLRPSYMEGEVEKTAQRWLEHRSETEDDLLLINVLDFEKPGYQIAIRAVPFPDNRATQGDMDLFARSVEFTPPPEGIKAPQKRRVKFPPGRQTLRMVSEMTILKWNCKERGVFELRRRDSYLVNSDFKAITTDWSACYYYHEWDNMMGKFGDLKPGQDVDFNRSVTTFFPVENHESLETGLKRFTNEIEELQALLRASIDKLPEIKVEEPSQVPTPPPEVNGKSSNVGRGEGKTVEGEGNAVDETKVNGGPVHTSKGKDKAEDGEWTAVSDAKPNGGPAPINKGKGKAGQGQWATTNQAKQNGGSTYANKGKGRAVNTPPNISKKRPEPRKNKYEVLDL